MVKRNSSLIVSLCMILSIMVNLPIVIAESGADNILANPSFETDANSDGVPDNWEPIATNNGDGQSADYAVDGSYSTKITGEVNKQKGFRQVLNISGNANTSLLFTGYSKTVDTLINGGEIGVIISLVNFDGSKSTYVTPFSKDGNVNWTKRSLIITAKKNFIAAEMYIGLRNQKGTVYFDNFSLLKQQ